MSLTKFDLSADYHTSDTPTTKKQRIYTQQRRRRQRQRQRRKKIITNETKSYTKCKTITILVETWPQITFASKLFSHLSCCHVCTVSSFWLVVCSYTHRERESLRPEFFVSKFSSVQQYTQATPICRLSASYDQHAQLPTKSASSAQSASCIERAYIHF